MCQLRQVGCKQKLHEIEERKKKISRRHIDGGDQYVLSATVISTQTPKCGNGVNLSQI